MKKLLIFSLVFAMTIVSCQKEYSLDNGVQTETFTVNTWDWTPTFNSASQQMGVSCSRTVSIITTEILNSGAVLVYNGNPGQTEWLQLPFTFIANSSVFYTWDSFVSSQSVKIDITESDLTWNSNFSVPVYFKVVCVSNSVLKEKNLTQEDFKEYNKLAQKLDLK